MWSGSWASKGWIKYTRSYSYMYSYTLKHNVYISKSWWYYGWFSVPYAKLWAYNLCMVNMVNKQCKLQDISQIKHYYIEARRISQSHNTYIASGASFKGVRKVACPLDKYLLPLKFKQRFRIKVSDTPIMTVVLNEIHVCVDYVYLYIHSLYYRYYYHYNIVLSAPKPLLLFLFHTSIISSKWLSVSSTGDCKAVFIKLERILSFTVCNS